MSEKGFFLPRIALNRPVSAVMVLLAVIIIGIIAYTLIPATMMPEGFEPAFLYVWLPYQNASPQEVEEQITKPVEEMFGTVRNIKRLECNSSQRGAGILVEFDSGTDMSDAYSQIVDRLDRVKPDLPQDQRFRFIWRWTPNSEPLMWVAIGIKKGYQVDDPYDLLDKLVKRRFEQTDGVAKVELDGAFQKSIYIEIKQDRMQSYKINMYRLWGTLQQANFTLSSGHITEGNKKLLVSSVAKFRSLDEIRNLLISGTNIRVGDIADVNYATEEIKRVTRINRLQGMSLAIYHEEQSKPIELSARLKKLAADIFENNPGLAPFEYHVLFTQGDIMSDTMDQFATSALVGGFLAILVLFFFLRKIKMTLIISMALPFSLMTTVTIMYFMGWSLNLLTMMGMILCVGMVVDNSIVVAENIFRLRQDGLSRRESSLRGASEVGLAITMSTLTTIIVFLPIILMSGDPIFSFFMSRLGMPVIISILLSLFIALYFIPLGTAVFHEPEKSAKFFLARWFDKLYDITIGRLNTSYIRVLKHVLTHRFDLILIVFFLFMTMFVIIPLIPRTDNLEGNINDFRIFLDMPQNNTLQDSNKITNRIEDLIWKSREKYDIKAIFSRSQPRRGMVRVFLNSPEDKGILWKAAKTLTKIFAGNDKKMSREAVIAELKKRIPESPGMKIRWGWSDQGSSDKSIDINIYGKDLKLLEIYADDVKRRVKRIPDILSVETDYQELGSDEVLLRVDRQMSKNLEIDPMSIAGTIAYALRGNLLTRFQLLDREIDVYLQLRKEDRKTLDQLKNLTVVSNKGIRYPLSTVVKPVMERGPKELMREDRKNMLRVKVTSSRDDLNVLFGTISAEMSKINFARGYSWTFGDRFRQLQDTESGMGQAIPIAIIFVFFLMGILFESFILPLSALASVPFAFWGAFWTLFITGTTADPMAYIGMIILIGVVVNNAIVLIDLINRLRKEGYERMEAITTAGRLRLRPILMTAFTTIFGLIPMSIGSSDVSGISYAPLGRAFTGGLFASTITTLILVPVIYTYLDDLRHKVGQSIFASIFSKSRAHAD